MKMLKRTQFMMSAATVVLTAFKEKGWGASPASVFRGKI